MTEAELNEIEARADAATPGPWFAGENSSGGANVYGPQHEDVTPAFADLRRTRDMEPEDAAFVANARSDVPKLLAEVRKLRLIIADRTGHEPGCLCNSCHPSHLDY